jgi:predicted ATPase
VLKKWGLKNFKSIYDANLELAPLTVLTGTNSSGKSSFIQSILLIAQTLRSNNYEDSLALNGIYVDLGQFDDIRSFNQDDNGEQKFEPLCINFIWEYPADFLYPVLNDEGFHKTISSIEFDAVASKNESYYSKEQLSPRINNILFEIDSIDNLGNIQSIKKSSITNITYQYSDIKSPKANIQLKHFWPSVETMPDLSNYSDVRNDDSLYNAFMNYFEYKFSYLGPLRHHDSIYPLSKSSRLEDIGIKGEYTAALLDATSNNNVSYIPVKYLYSTGLEKSIIIKPLSRALKYWLNYLCISDDIKPELTKHGYEMKLITDITNENNFNVNLSHVGTGISQILPILVSCLLAEKESMLIFEQPELHLHPQVQSRLADFFISMALIGKQCIIETHSEYFVDMLRLRICQSLLKENVEIKKSTKIYYFDKERLKTTIKEIEINEFGDYNIWPDNFFDERQRISDEILNSINEKMFNESSETNLKDESPIYEEDIYIDNKYGSLKYFLFDDINILKDAINIHIKQLGITDFAFKDGLEWTFNPSLPEKVKDVMNKYNVNFSLASYIEGNYKITVINKRDNNEWYTISSSEEIKQGEDNSEVPND